MHTESPPESVHALDLDGFRRPEITFLTAWRRASGACPGDEGEQTLGGTPQTFARSTVFNTFP
ncbi:hypothetical protein RZS08_47685 [Arthrospira platensis SPKY1]|nr:hypothetical protein [Arthrospira platensis SPKY1]